MKVDEIRRYCLAFPEATENLQWGDDLCFKINGKIFAIVSLDDPKLCFKCAPETFAELIEREGIGPAPYVGRYKWVMVDGLNVLGRNEAEELIRQSYAMVAAKAPRGRRKKASGKKVGSKEKSSGRGRRLKR